MILYADNNQTAVYNGVSFKRDKQSGYFLSSCKIGGKRKWLHVVVWETEKGTVPEGYVVHHIDGDKYNNNIENLTLLSKSEHIKHHASNWTDEHRDRLRKNLAENALPKAVEWHKSESGSEWHKKHYEETKDKLHEKKEFVCDNCGKAFTAEATGANRFCSPNCKSAYRRKSGVDNEERKCEVCGDVFITNKYSKAKYCSKHRNRAHRNS